MRITVSGLRSSWLALATKRSCAANASAAGASSRPASAQPRAHAITVAPTSAIRYWLPSSASAASACSGVSVRPRWPAISQYDTAISSATDTVKIPP